MTRWNNGEKKLDNRLLLNIGGSRHETTVSTLEKLPNTRLGKLAKLREEDEAYDPEKKEYFFDRHSRCFEVVLQYYRSEELHIDSSLCGSVLQREFEFWGLQEQDIEPCCWSDYSKYTEHKQTLADLDQSFAFVEDTAWSDRSSAYRRMSQRIWTFLEEPRSSRLAKLYAITSMFFVVLSIGVFVLETHKLFQVDRYTGKPMTEVDPDDATPTGSATVCCCDNERKNSTSTLPETHAALKSLDYVCVAYFSLEIIVRVLVSPDKKKFIKSPLNIIDIVCLLPHYVAIALDALNTSGTTRTLFKSIMMLRVIRVLRIFKLMKHYSAFKILVYTIKVSSKELLLMIIFLLSGVLMFASLIHYVEPENFPNIPIGVWWALVTMTTVGYGDKYPISYLGFVMGSFCVICGVLVIAFTVPIVVNNFTLYYSHAQTRIKLPARKKKARRLLIEMTREMGKRSLERKKLQEKEKQSDSKNAKFDDLEKTGKTSNRNVRISSHSSDENNACSPVETTKLQHKSLAREMLAKAEDARGKVEEQKKKQEELISKKKEERAKRQRELASQASNLPSMPIDYVVNT